MFPFSHAQVNTEFGEPPNKEQASYVDDMCRKADAMNDEAPRLVIALTIAAHFDFCLRLRASDGFLTASHVFRSNYEVLLWKVVELP